MKFRKVIIVFVLILVVTSLTSLFVLGKLKHPEKAILGDWKEVSWHYELADSKSAQQDKLEAGADNSLEHDIFNQLIIHKSEKWKFDRNSGLTLSKENQDPVKIKWKLKGRGHILKLTYAGDTVEYYQIKELTDRKMVLRYENDLHARSIIKIVFTKNKK